VSHLECEAPLKTYLDLRGRKQQEARKYYITKKFIFPIWIKYYAGDKIQEVVVITECSVDR